MDSHSNGVDIYLASESPRRRELLEQLGVRFRNVEQSVDETMEPGESPEVFVIRLALEKARAGLAASPRDAPVLGADTMVVLDDEAFGKPRDQAEAMQMLERLGGQSHRVLTGVAMVDSYEEATRLSVTHVTLRALSEDEREAYWASGEPADKAGAYAIQGRGAVFVEHLDGSYSGVMGLPLFETGELLGEFGIDFLSGWRRA
ncbi:Maf family protein [Arhodomonas sp. SL1]|uniref:Maf family protein n=1 Tax=Arhodomonas sp. SL1 TaxID=3425691 RepID=UPI003F8848B7